VDLLPAIGTRRIRQLPRIVNEVRGDPGRARAEVPDIVTHKRKFEPVRVVTDQLGEMAAERWPRDGIELAR
jgi:hypothetical protein